MGESGLEFETLKTVAHIERIEEKSDNIVLEKIKEEVKKKTVLTRSFKEEIHRENYIYPLKEGDIKLERLDDKTIQVLFKPHELYKTVHIDIKHKSYVKGLKSLGENFKECYNYNNTISFMNLKNSMIVKKKNVVLLNAKSV